MLANRVKESSATTGTGNITLAGTTSGFQTFASKFSVNERLTYTIDSDSGQWEIGVGYLSGATTLVREEIKENSAGTTVAISFTGSLNVFVSVTTFEAEATPYATADTASSGARFDGQVGRSSYNNLNAYEGGIFYPVRNFTGRKVSQLGVAIGIADAGDTNTRVAIYKNSAAGLPGKLIVSTTALSATAAVLLFGSVTTFYLPEGAYWVACLTESTTVAFKGSDINELGCSWFGSEGNRPRSNLLGVTPLTSFADDPPVVSTSSGTISAAPDIRTKP